MNRKQLILLVGVLAVLAILARIATTKKQKPYRGSEVGLGEKLMPEFPLNDIAQVNIIQATQQLTLAKADDQWTVRERGGYPADYSKIKEALTKIWQMKVAKPVRVPESRLPALELLPPDQGGGTRVEFNNAEGKNLHQLLLGAKDMKESTGNPQFGGGGSYPVGRYVMVDKDPQNIALVSDPLTSFEPRPADWISKDFFKVEKVKSIRVDAAEETNSWSIQRETDTGSWSLVNPKPEESLDSSKVNSANYLLSSPYFNDIVVNPDPAELGLDNPRTATLQTFSNFTYTVKLGKALPDDNYPLQVAVSADLPNARTPADDEKEEDKERLDKEFQENLDKLKEKLEKEKKFANWTYKISKWSVDFLLKNRHDLLAEKKEEEKAEPATSSSTNVTSTPAVVSPPVQVPPPPDTEKIQPPTTPPAESTAAKPKPEESQPQEPKPEETKPAQPQETQPPEPKPEEAAPTESKPEQSPSDQPKSEEPAPAPKQVDESAPDK